VHSLEGCSLPRSLPLSCIGNASIENSRIDLRGEIRRFYNEKQMNRLTKCTAWLTGQPVDVHEHWTHPVDL
jgi:hypothetical protein